MPTLTRSAKLEGTGEELELFSGAQAQARNGRDAVSYLKESTK